MRVIVSELIWGYIHMSRSLHSNHILIVLLQIHCCVEKQNGEKKVIDQILLDLTVEFIYV